MKRFLVCVVSGVMVLACQSVWAAGASYYASCGDLPEVDDPATWEFIDNGQSTFYAEMVGTAPNSILHGVALDPDWRAMIWRDTAPPDSIANLVCEMSAQVLDNCGSYDTWGGFGFYVRGADAYNVNVMLDEDRVLLMSSGQTLQTYMMDTTDMYHTYRLEVVDYSAEVYVDGVSRLTLSLGSDSSSAYCYFGTNGWEGSEFNVEYIWYETTSAVVPEPSTALLCLGAAVLFAAIRRRRG